MRRLLVPRRPLAALLLALVLGLIGAPLAAAHPLGNFSVNRYSGLEVQRDGVQLRYVLDLAEIPTVQELNAIGLDAARFDDAARQRLLATKARELAGGARLTISDRTAEWTLHDSSLELLPGQADLPTMRISLTLGAAGPVPDRARLEYHDLNYRGRAGWQEVVLRGGNGVSLAGSNVPSESVTDELREYPADPTSAPLGISSAAATVGLVAGGASNNPTATNRTASTTARFGVDATADHLTGFLRNGAGNNPLTLLLALAVAAGLGAMHALGPGHGKTVVGAYLVGSRGTARHAAFLGLTVTLTHTVGVYALGLVTLVAAQYVLPERLFPVLGVISGLLVVGIGLSLARSRFAALFGGWGFGVESRGVHTDHSHGHEHPHSHEHAHEHPHSHEHDPSYGQTITHHSSLTTQLPTPAVHSHGGGTPHSHVPPGADGQPITLKSLLALGVSGGLLPCPSALVVLLAAISFQNVALGMALVAAFSVGLAAVLTGIGLMMVYGGRWLGRSRLAGRLSGSPLTRAVPALSALAITAAGLVITVQAVQTLP